MRRNSNRFRYHLWPVFLFYGVLIANGQKHKEILEVKDGHGLTIKTIDLFQAAFAPRFISTSGGKDTTIIIIDGGNQLTTMKSGVYFDHKRLTGKQAVEAVSPSASRQTVDCSLVNVSTEKWERAKGLPGGYSVIYHIENYQSSEPEYRGNDLVGVNDKIVILNAEGQYIASVNHIGYSVSYALMTDDRKYICYTWSDEMNMADPETGASPVGFSLYDVAKARYLLQARIIDEGFGAILNISGKNIIVSDDYLYDEDGRYIYIIDPVKKRIGRKTIPGSGEKPDTVKDVEEQMTFEAFNQKVKQKANNE